MGRQRIEVGPDRAAQRSGVPGGVEQTVVERQVQPARPKRRRRYTKGIVPVLRQLADQKFRGSALGDLGYRGKRLAKANQVLGICWVVECSFCPDFTQPSVDYPQIGVNRIRKGPLWRHKSGPQFIIESNTSDVGYIAFNGMNDQ
jgi:hypothetical protein